jgi:hypothetical protein
MLINSNRAPHLFSYFSETSYFSSLKIIDQIKAIIRKSAKDIQINAKINPKISPFLVVSLV